MNKDDKCFYSITRKAKLTQKLNEIYKNKTKQFDELAEYIGKIKAKFNDQNEIRISCSSIIVNIVFIAEAFIKDILEEIIYSNSKAIEYEKIEIKRIVDLNNISKIIFNAAESYCYKYFYNNIYKIISDLHNIHDFAELTNIDLESIGELYATRNIIVHNNDIVNDKYLELARGKARTEKGKK